MSHTHSIRHGVAYANRALARVDRWRNKPAFTLTASEAIEIASQVSGLEDFECEEFGAPLRMLCATTSDPRLPPLQRWQRRREILQRVTNRLCIERALQADPDIRHEVIDRPWFIIGLPRSGTTLLHRLLAQDPASRAPLLWEVRAPCQRGRYDSIQRRIRDARFATALLYYIAPGLKGLHSMAAHLPEECDMLLDNSLAGGFWAGGSDEFYRDYLALDRSTAYRLHRLQLQCLQRERDVRTWILKTPTHLAHLRSLLRVYGDARLIQIHRDPVEALPSSANLIAVLAAAQVGPVDMRAIGQSVYGYAKQAFYPNFISEQAAAAQAPGVRVVNVRYSDLVRDPMATLESIYHAFDCTLSERARLRMMQYLRKDGAGGHAQRRYTPEDFGLDVGTIRRECAEYIDRYVCG